MTIERIKEVSKAACDLSYSLITDFRNVREYSERGNSTAALICLDSAEEIMAKVDHMLSSLNMLLGRKRGMILLANGRK